jgi:hypothetical protein
MGIGLIIARDDGNSRREITLSEWQGLVVADDEIRLSSEPIRTPDPDSGEVIALAVQPGASELRLEGEWVLFLTWQRGTLRGRYLHEMEAETHPVRCKIAELSRKLNASIFVDVQDEPLDW